MSPYELGLDHATKGQPSANPYMFPSDMWVLYNRGYNKIAHPLITDVTAAGNQVRT